MFRKKPVCWVPGLTIIRVFPEFQPTQLLKVQGSTEHDIPEPDPAQRELQIRTQDQWTRHHRTPEAAPQDMMTGLDL